MGWTYQQSWILSTNERGPGIWIGNTFVISCKYLSLNQIVWEYGISIKHSILLSSLKSCCFIQAGPNDLLRALWFVTFCMTGHDILPWSDSIVTFSSIQLEKVPFKIKQSCICWQLFFGGNGKIYFGYEKCVVVRVFVLFYLFSINTEITCWEVKQTYGGHLGWQSVFKAWYYSLW